MDEALQHVSNAIEMDSTYWRARAVLGLYYELDHRSEEAIEAYERANGIAGSTMHRTRADMARVLAGTDREQQARQLIVELETEARVTGVYEPTVATALMALGEKDASFAWLEQSHQRKHPHLAFIAGDARFASFQEEPRFIDLMRRAGVRR
jgi:tetratricopeptide (TPR) repeat protein